MPIRHSLFALMLLLLLPGTALSLDLAELVREVEVQYTGRSSFALVSMEVRTENWERRMEMESWSYGRDYFLTRITEPAKEKGVTTLKAEKEVWNYLPKVDRVIKVPASMMGGFWMGSHITNDDLVKGSQVDKDYTFGLLEETDQSWLIECLPRPEAAVVWGKIHYRIAKAGRIPMQVEYFDEAMEKVREILFEDVQSVQGRAIPLRMVVQPLDKPAERTVMQYRDIEFDIAIGQEFFSLRNLKKRP
ncbi:outer membrane lipoprotein-sorting protein [Desulfuromonas versatilis]|nr:outer membrane lipoprotein-sorting protein [Desulfuromonas versatilis]